MSVPRRIVVYALPLLVAAAVAALVVARVGGKRTPAPASVARRPSTPGPRLARALAARLSQLESRLAADAVESVEVRWPSGVRTSLKGLKADQEHVVTEEG